MSAAQRLPVLGGVIELDQLRTELLDQDSDYVHKEHKIHLVIEKEKTRNMKNDQL